MDATQASSPSEQIDLSYLYFAPFANLLIKNNCFDMIWINPWVQAYLIEIINEY